MISWLTSLRVRAAKLVSSARPAAVAERASEIATLIATATPPNRDENLSRLRPMMVDGIAELIKAEVLDHVSERTTT